MSKQQPWLSPVLLARTVLVVTLCSLTNFSLVAVAAPQEAAPAAEPQRRLPFSTTLNTRDLGGYSTADNQKLKWGVLFRSDSLAYLDDDDLATLEALQLAAVTDFRSAAERKEAPDRLPQQSPAIDYRTLGINDPAVDVAELGRKFFSGELTEVELIALTDRTAYINDPELSRMWGQWVRDLAEPGTLPQLFHCTAGKDRTGFAAAILLLTLGVPKEIVMQDFLLTNEYLAAKIDANVIKIQANSKVEIDEEILRQAMGVSRQSLEDAFQAMETRYGSIDGYIEQGLGIDAATRARLQALLLE